MSTGRICCREVDLAELDESVWRVAERMHQRCVGTLVVVDDQQAPVGIVTDRDLVERVLAQARDIHATRVADVMTSPVHCVSQDAAIETSLALMRNAGVRRLPVVDGAGALVGLIAFDDILMLLSEELAQIGPLLGKQTPSGVAES